MAGGQEKKPIANAKPKAKAGGGKYYCYGSRVYNIYVFVLANACMISVWFEYSPNSVLLTFVGGKKKEVKKETGLGLSYKKDDNFGEWYSEVCLRCLVLYFWVPPMIVRKHTYFIGFNYPINHSCFLGKKKSILATHHLK